MCLVKRLIKLVVENEAERVSDQRWIKVVSCVGRLLSGYKASLKEDRIMIAIRIGRLNLTAVLRLEPQATGRHYLMAEPKTCSWRLEPRGRDPTVSVVFFTLDLVSWM